MNNFGHAIDATNTALDSQGSAMRENAAYMESVQAKLSQLQSTFQDFANNVIGSDLAKGILDIANVLLKLANTPLGQVVTQILLLTSLGWGATSLIKALKIFSIAKLQFANLIPLFKNLTLAIKGAQGPMLAFAGASSIALPIIAAISAAIVGLIALSKTDWFKETFHEADYVNEKIDTLNSELETTKQKIEELKAQGASQNVIDVYSDKLDSLTKQLDEFNERKFHVAFGELDKTWDVDEYGDTFLKVENAITSNINKLNELKTAMANASSTEEFERLEQQYYDTYDALKKYYDIGKDANEQGIEFTDTERELWYQLVDIYGTTEEVAKKKAELALATTNNSILTAKETKALLAQANQLGVSKTKMAELSAQTIIFNNTKLDVSQKIDALRQLAVQAGVTKDMINWANKDEEYDRYMLRMTGHGMSGEEAERRYLSSLWDKWTKSLYKKVPEEDDDEGGGGGGGTTKAKTAVEKLTDAWKEELNALKDRLELLQKSGASEEEQIEQMRKIQQAIHDTAEKYRALGLSEESEYLRQLGILWWDYENKIQDVYDDIEEAAKKAAEEAKQAWKESLEQQKSWYETAASVVLDKIDEEMEAKEKEREAEEQKWNDRIQVLKDTNAQLDDQIKKEQLLNNLAKAKQKQVYVYKDGRFQYVQDVDEIASAQAELDTYERDKQLEDEVNRLEKLKDAALDKIDKQIEGWKDYRKEWENTVKQYTKYQDKMIAQMILGTDLEQKNWQTRIKNAQEFADEYTEIMKNLAALNGETLPDSVTDKNGVTIDKYGRKTSGTSTVNPDAIMSKKDSDALAAAGKKWTNAKTDAERAAAHKEAEAIRAKYGYSGGVAGDKYIPKNASGTLSSQGGLSLVGEKGPELRVLNSGDGVIPADITRNLWNWGKINPSTFGNKSVNHVFNISNLSLPGVRDAESLVSGLKRMAYQRAYQRA